MLQHIHSLLEEVTLVVPTSRLANLIATDFHVTQIAAGKHAWPSPKVLSWSAWLTESYEQLMLARHPVTGDRILLTTPQERLLWESIVGEHDDVEPAMVESLANLAMQAWSTAQLWQVPFDSEMSNGGLAEVRAFRLWARRFEHRCADLGSVDQATFAKRLVAARGDVMRILPRFSLYGFSRLPTALNSLDVMSVTDDPLPPVNLKVREFSNRELELDTVAGWAGRLKLAQPTARVCLALPAANKLDHGTVSRLRRVFVGSGVDPDLLATIPVGNLIDIPIIEHAKMLLDRRESYRWDEVTRRLLSPYVAGAVEELGSRALLDAKLRDQDRYELTAAALDSVLIGSGCPILAERLRAIEARFENLPARQTMHEWMAFVSTVLEVAGWPGTNALTERERSAVELWHRCLDTAASLDAIVPTCNWPTAFARLRAILRQRNEAPVPHVHSVSVVTPFEAAFLGPENLWVAGFHDGAWPESSEANPLLPLGMQRDRGVPGTNPTEDIAAATLTLGTLVQRFPQAIWSFPALEDDVPRRAITGSKIVRADIDDVIQWPPLENGTQVSRIDDERIAPIENTKDNTGGVSLFADQAACPFRAVARHRLGVTRLVDPTPGLSKAHRGTLQHSVLAMFWESVKSALQLRQNGATKNSAIVRRCVEEVIARFRSRFDLPAPYWAIEHDRLCAITEQWLAYEYNRADFEVIACERPSSMTLGGIVIRTRVDRIDRLTDGREVIIDYKTGDVSRKNWELPRPDDPQLPLYALAHDSASIAGIAYAKVKKGQCAIYEEPKGLLTHPVTDSAGDSNHLWLERIEQWRQALEGIAEEIENGIALARPKRGATTCRYCELQTFCRVYQGGVSSQRDQLEVDDDD